MVWTAVMDNPTLTCEIRFTDDDTRQTPGRIVGTLVNYGERARNLPEIIDAGALYWDDGGIVLNEQHERGQPIIRALPYLDAGAVKIDAPLLNTARCRDAATNVKGGVFTGLSVEMQRNTVKGRNIGGVFHITSAKLVAAGLVDLAEYPGSSVSIRQAATADATIPDPWEQLVWL